MAAPTGTALRRKLTAPYRSDLHEAIVGLNQQIHTVRIAVADLAAGADITARAEFVCPAALYITGASIIPIAASTGVDGSNTIVVTLQNITQSAATIGTVTNTTNYVANTPVALTMTAANQDAAASDVIGIVVTQGAAADSAGFYVQFNYRLHEQIADGAGTVYATS